MIITDKSVGTSSDIGTRDFGMPKNIRNVLLKAPSVRHIVSSRPPELSRQHYLDIGLPIFHETGEIITVRNRCLVYYPPDDVETMIIAEAHLIFAGWVKDKLCGHFPTFIYKGRLCTWGHNKIFKYRNLTLESLIEAKISAGHINCVTIYFDHHVGKAYISYDSLDKLSMRNLCLNDEPTTILVITNNLDMQR